MKSDESSFLSGSFFGALTGFGMVMGSMQRGETLSSEIFETSLLSISVTRHLRQSGAFSSSARASALQLSQKTGGVLRSVI